MNQKDIWKILGIEETKDEELIKNAYRANVVKVNPEDDAEGFKLLREAYDEAMAYAASSDEEGEKKPEKEGPPVCAAENENPAIKAHMDQAREIYEDIFERINLKNWEDWFKDPICTELDTADDMRECFLAMTMSRYMLPYEVWKMADDTFGIVDARKDLSEIFPPDYIDFIVNRVQNESFVDFERFMTRDEFIAMGGDVIEAIKVEGEPGTYEPEGYYVPLDTYIRECQHAVMHIDNVLYFMYEEHTKSKDDEVDFEGNKERVKEGIKTLCCVVENMSEYEIFHPLELSMKMRALSFTDRLDEALQIADFVLAEENLPTFDRFTKGTAAFLKVWDIMQRGVEAENVEEINRIEKIMDEEIEIFSHQGILHSVKGLILMMRDEYRDSADSIINALDANRRDAEASMVLKYQSHKAVEYYTKKIEEGTANNDERQDLAWVYFRLEEPEKTFEVLKTFKAEPGEDGYYGYNNLWGRCYYNKDQYKEARPYLAKWVEMIENLNRRKNEGEELSKKDNDRITRTAFAYFLYASTLENLKEYDEAVKFYEKSVGFLENKGVEDINEYLYYLETYGNLLEQQGKLDEAAVIWNKMVDAIPRCIPGYIRRQKNAHKRHDPNQVIDDYFNITRDFPEYAEAYELAARVFYIYGRNADMEKVLNRSKEFNCESDGLKLQWAKLYLVKKNPDAEELLVQLLDKTEKDEAELEYPMEVYECLANFYLNSRDDNGNRNRLDECRNIVEMGQKKDPDNKRLMWVLTDLEEFQGKDPVPVYEEMLRLFPDDAYVDFEYAEYLWRRREKEKAYKWYLSTLKKDPEGNTVRSANNRLMTFFRERYMKDEDRSDYNKAVEYALRQLEIVEDDYFLVEAGLLYIDGYEFDKALEVAKKAVEMAPENVYAHNLLGLVNMRLSRYRDAEASFLKGIEVMTPGEEETLAPYYNMAKLCRADERYVEAEKWYMRLINEKKEADSEIFRKLSRLYMRMEEYDNAIKALDKEIKIYQIQWEKNKDIWLIESIVKTMLIKIEIAIVTGNKTAYKQYHKDIEKLVHDRFGYDLYKSSIVTNNEYRQVLAEICEDMASHYTNNEREYKKAIKLFFSYRELLCKPTKGGSGLKYLDARPEEETDHLGKLDSIARAYMSYATALFMSKKRKDAYEIATRAEYAIKKAFGSYERYLSFLPDKPSRLRIVAIIRFIIGHEAEAHQAIDLMDKIYRCDFCNDGVCYDKALMFGRLFEMEGDREKAISFFESAANYAPEDCEVFMALRELKK